VDPSKYEDRWERYLAKTHENVRQTLEKYIESKNRIKLLDVSTGSGKLHEYLAKSNLNLSEAAFNDPDREMLSKDRKQVIRDALDCKTTFYHEDTKSSKNSTLSSHKTHTICIRTSKHFSKQ
jgi:ubiquinone/menaquinone biosynthesis C-methylase UbiE